MIFPLRCTPVSEPLTTPRRSVDRPQCGDYLAGRMGTATRTKRPSRSGSCLRAARLALVTLPFALMFALPACGGIAEYEPPDTKTPSGGSSAGGLASGGDSNSEDATGGADPGGGSPSVGGNDGSGGGGSLDGQATLGPCVEGFLYVENPSLQCNWLAEGRCYDEKLDACACICPRRGSSTCLSGFYGGDGSATRVSCY